MKRFFLVLLAIALLWGGGRSVYTSLKNSAPAASTCAQVLMQPPAAEWLSLSECEYDLENLAYVSLLTTVSELYVPLRPKGDSGGSPARVVLLTKDAELLELVSAIESASASPGDSASAEVLRQAERLAEIQAPERVTGLVKFGIELKDSDMKELKVAVPTLPEDFMLLEHGARPQSMALSLALLGAGLLLSAWLAWKILVPARGGLAS